MADSGVYSKAEVLDGGGKAVAWGPASSPQPATPIFVFQAWRIRQIPVNESFVHNRQMAEFTRKSWSRDSADALVVAPGCISTSSPASRFVAVSIEITARDDHPAKEGCEIPLEVLHFRDHEFGRLVQRFFSQTMKLPPRSVDFYNNFAKTANGDSTLPHFARVFTMKRLPERLRLFTTRQHDLPLPKEQDWSDVFDEVMAMKPPPCVRDTFWNICSRLKKLTQKNPPQKESAQKQSTQQGSAHKKPTAQEETKQNGHAKGEPNESTGVSSQVFDDFIETSKWLATLMKSNNTVASTVTDADFLRFKEGFERFDALLQPVAEGALQISSDELEDLLRHLTMTGTASTLWVTNEGEELLNRLCTLRADRLAERLMHEHRKFKSVAWGSAAGVLGVAAVYGVALIAGGPIAASIIGTSWTAGWPLGSYLVGIGTAPTAVASAITGSAAVVAKKSYAQSSWHTACRQECVKICEQINAKHASFQTAFQSVSRILLIRLAKDLGVFHLLQNGDPALKLHFRDAYGIDLEALKETEYSVALLNQERRRLRKEFESLTGEIDKLSGSHDSGLPQE